MKTIREGGRRHRRHATEYCIWMKTAIEKMEEGTAGKMQSIWRKFAETEFLNVYGA
jgi:hypothetical protein